MIDTIADAVAVVLLCFSVIVFTVVPVWMLAVALLAWFG